jgi:hypothetical protein
LRGVVSAKATEPEGFEHKFWDVRVPGWTVETLLVGMRGGFETRLDYALNPQPYHDPFFLLAAYF